VQTKKNQKNENIFNKSPLAEKRETSSEEKILKIEDGSAVSSQSNPA
jgi:hypothetical protein